MVSGPGGKGTIGHGGEGETAHVLRYSHKRFVFIIEIVSVA